jgi:hypothetical protein
MKTKVQETFCECCILDATIEHNGHQGGDAGHGGYVELVLKDLGGCAMEINGKRMHEIVLRFSGDSEGDVLTDALDMFVRVLKATRNRELLKMPL